MKKLITTLLISAACALPSLSFADGGSRLKANPNPVIAVDASGQAVLDRTAGTANDRFTAEVEIAKRFRRARHHAGEWLQR